MIKKKKRKTKPGGPAGRCGQSIPSSVLGKADVALGALGRGVWGGGFGGQRVSGR